MLRFFQSLSHAFRGLKTAWKEEPNFRIQTVLSGLVLCGSFYFQLSYTEFIAVVVSIVLILSAEIFNTAIEDLCNKVEPKEDSQIKKIKDLIAAGVLASSLGGFILGVFTFLHHFIIK